jgi:hypothetical protein
MLWHVMMQFEVCFNVVTSEISFWICFSWRYEVKNWNVGFASTPWNLRVFFLMLWSLKLQFDVCSNDFKFETETWGLFLTFYLL